MKWFKYLWAGPTTLVALLLFWPTARMLGTTRVERGCVEIWGPVVRWILRRSILCKNASAMTLGHVIIGQNESCLARARDHEHVHVRQYERWGPFFIPAYLLASVWMLARGRDGYLENPFEVEAYSKCP